MSKAAVMAGKHAGSAAGEEPLRYLARVQIYTLYERFWHWAQAALILFMLFTGFQLHGSFQWMSYEAAYFWHVVAALALMTLWVFTIFWQFATGNWRHFVPLLDEARHAPTLAQAVRGWLVMMVRIARYYAWGIMRGEQHPYRKKLRRKHNPLQALAYFGLMVFIGPLLWISGLALLTFDFWQHAAAISTTESLRAAAAFFHMLGAWLMLIFVIAHGYMATLGKTPLYLIRGMITGVEHIWLTETELKFLQQWYPQRVLEVQDMSAQTAEKAAGSTAQER